MAINYNKAEFIRSAVRPEAFIRDGRPQVTFAGRSNVGKSSVINRLLNRKNFARVGATPGKTTQVNYFLIDNRVYLTDLPGYGYAKVSKEERDRWGRLMESYFQEPGLISLGVLIVDARLGAVLRGGVRNGGGGELAVCAGHGDHLVAGGLDRAGLVHVDVAGVGSDHGLPRAQERSRGEQVRLRAADEKVHVGIRTGKAGADGVGRAAVVVEPVAGGGVEIRVAQGAQNVRVCALGIVILEAEHGGFPFVCVGFGTQRVPPRL